MQDVEGTLDIIIRPMLVSILPNWKRNIDLFYYDNESNTTNGYIFLEDNLDLQDN